MSREYQGAVWCYIDTMGEEQRLLLTISPTLSAAIRNSLSNQAAQIVPDLVTRYLNLKSVNQALSFNDSHSSLATRLFNSVQESTVPLLRWAKDPKGRCEFFMYKRSQIRDKFSKLVSTPIEFLAIVQQAVTKFIESKLANPVYGRRAQIMSIRGLALSCAPNFTRVSDIKSFSRLYREFA